MKLMIASDLHGSAYWTELLLRRCDEERPERLLLLGDLLYHGPRNDLPEGYDTKKTAELLNALLPAPLCVRGNCDAEVDQMVLSFPMLTKFAAVTAEGRTLYLTHGHHMDEAVRTVLKGDAVLYGHTHLPDFSERDGVFFINPGSVSLPKDNTSHSYLVLANGELLWKDAGSGEILRLERLPE